MLHREGLDAYVVRRLGLPFRDVDWTVWGDLLDRVHAPKETVTVALVGKYIDLPDAYLSVTEALRAGGFAHRSRVQIRWVPSDDCETPEGAAHALAGVDGVCVPGGFGVRGIEGKLGALKYTRDNGIPTLGLCLGPAVHGHRVRPRRRRPGEGELGRSSTPRRPTRHRHHGQPASTSSPASATWAARCGWAATRPSLQKGSVAAAAYGSTDVTERHRHRYEVANAYRDRLSEAGLVFSGTSPDGLLVEFAELPRDVHPFYVGTQAHPELKSRPDPAAPAVRRVRAGRDRLPGGRAAARCRSTRRRRSASDGTDESRTSSRCSTARRSTRAGSSRCAGTRSPCPAAGEQRPRGRRTTRARSPWSRSTTQDRVVLLRQYRHPVGEHLWELPAGLRDADGEPPLETAKRELAEEALLAADRWSLLVTVYNSPGLQRRAACRSTSPRACRPSTVPRASSSSTRRRT